MRCSTRGTCCRTTVTAVAILLTGIAATITTAETLKQIELSALLQDDLLDDHRSVRIRRRVVRVEPVLHGILVAVRRAATPLFSLLFEYTHELLPPSKKCLSSDS
jgi:hypothetical protein